MKNIGKSVFNLSGGSYFCRLSLLMIVCASVLSLNGCATNYVGTVRGPIYLPGVNAAWNQVQPGMTREQVHHLLGEPHQTVGTSTMDIYQDIDTINNQGTFQLQIQYDAGGCVAKRVFQLLPY